MVNSIAEAIAAALDKEFGDEYATYTESVEQGLNEPCFFVQCIDAQVRLFRGKRYFRENRFCVQYFPKDELAAKAECEAVAERLFWSLEVIDDGEGGLMRGSNMDSHVEDGILSFFVSYNAFVYRAAEDTEKMAEMDMKYSEKMAEMDMKYSEKEG